MSNVAYKFDIDNSFIRSVNYLITLNNLTHNQNYFSMNEDKFYDSWKGGEISSTNVTSNPYTICSNHTYFDVTSNQCTPCDLKTLDPNCNVCGGVKDGISQCQVCDNTQGDIQQLSNNKCYLRNNTCRWQEKDADGNDTTTLLNDEIANPTGSVCKPCTDYNKFIDLTDMDEPKCSINQPFSILLEKGDNMSKNIDVNMLDFNKE